MQDGLQLSDKFAKVLLREMESVLWLIAGNRECEQDVLGLDFKLAFLLEGELVLALLIFLLLNEDAIAWRAC